MGAVATAGSAQIVVANGDYAYGVGQDTILDGQGFVPGATVTVALANIRGFSSTAEVVFEITTDGDGKIVERDSSADFGSVHGTSSNYEVGCDATRASDKEDGRGGYSYGITYQLPSGGEDVTIRAAYGGVYGEVKVASTVVLSNTRFDGGGQQACQWSEGGLHWSGSDGTLYGVHPDDFHQLTCGGDRKPILTYADCVVAANAFDHACPAVSFGASIASSVADEDWAGTKGCHVQEHIEHAATQWGAASWQFNRNMDGAGGGVEAPELKWQDTCKCSSFFFILRSLTREDAASQIATITATWKTTGMMARCRPWRSARTCASPTPTASTSSSASTAAPG